MKRKGERPREWGKALAAIRANIEEGTETLMPRQRLILEKKKPVREKILIIKKVCP